MKKRYLLLYSLLALLIIEVNAQSTKLSEVPAFNVSVAYDALDATAKINRTGPSGKLIDYLELNEQKCSIDEGKSSRSNVYVDKIETVINVKSGKTYTLKMKHKSIFSWMHTCVWIDYNNDQFFSKEEGYATGSSSELVSFDFFSNDPDRVKGVNSLGVENIVPNGFPGIPANGLYSLPSFTIPENAPAGKVRMRFICNWSSVDPSGLIVGLSLGTGATPNSPASVGGTIVDLSLNIEKDTYPVTFTEPDSQFGTLKIKNGDSEVTNGEQVAAGTTLSIEADPSSNEYALKAIFVNGEAISGNTVTVESDMNISVEFIKGRWLTYTATEGGSFTVKQGETDIASETAVELGSALQLAFTPNTGYELKSFIMNKQDVTADVENNAYTISSVTDNIDIQVTFAKKNFKFSYSFNQLGDVKVKTGGVDIEDGQMIPYNTVLNITVIPGNQSFVKSILLDGEEKMEELLPDGNSNFTLTITKETTLKIEFDATKYTISCNTPQYGTMKVVNQENSELIYSDGAQIPFATTLDIYLTADETGKLLKLMIDEGDGPIDYVAEGGVDLLEDGTYYTYIQAFNNVSINATFSIPTSINNTDMESATISLTQEGYIAVEGAPVGSMIQVYNVIGQEIAKAVVQQNTETIVAPTQVFYLIKVSNKAGTVVKKLTK